MVGWHNQPWYTGTHHQWAGEQRIFACLFREYEKELRCCGGYGEEVEGGGEAEEQFVKREVGDVHSSRPYFANATFVPLKKVKHFADRWKYRFQKTYSVA